MNKDDGDVNVRPGRVRSTRSPQAKSFLNQVLRAAKTAGHVSGQTGGGNPEEERPTLVLAHRSDFDLDRQIVAPGATWLDHRLVERTATPLATGADAGDPVSGVYRQRLTLSSGRFAMIDTGLGFQLVPWSREIETKLGQRVSGVAKAGGGIEWSIGRKRDLGL
ncbi:DUF3363 domain-containing protein [Azospirillum sp.]|uniref:DUF3363 domain-containing protein n=1 Tax=Azospirillum sp. TaxID=34012 RepID=UPI003415892D